MLQNPDDSELNKLIIYLIFLTFLFHQTLNFLFCIGVEPINNVVVVSSEQ